jgi:hypothetical protein
MSAGGYDISASVSEASTQGLENKFGSFTVGGGIRIPEWTWPLLVVGAAIVLGIWLWKRK